MTEDLALAFCVGDQCRQQRAWKRALPTSPVYACTTCGRTREFSTDEPGSASGSAVTPAALPARPSRFAQRRENVKRIMDLAKRDAAPAETIPPKHETKGPVRGTRRPIKETIMKKNILQEAIDAAVKAATSPLIEQLEALEEKVKELVARDLAEEIEEALSGLLGSSPAAAKKKRAKASPAAAAAEDGDCGHKNSMTKCPSCRAKKAAAEAAK